MKGIVTAQSMYVWDGLLTLGWLYSDVYLKGILAAALKVSLFFQYIRFGLRYKLRYSEPFYNK